MNSIFSSKLLKDVAVMTAIYGSGTILYEFFANGSEIDIVGELIKAIFFGVFFSVSMYYVNRAYLQDVTKSEPTPEQEKLHQTKQLKSQVQPEVICRKMEQMDSIRKVNIDLSAKMIYGTTRWTSFSFGDKVAINYQELKGNIYNYTISSKPMFFLQRYDGGINLANVLALEKLILSIQEEVA